MTAQATVLSVTLALEQGGVLGSVEIATAFDRIQSPEAARAAGRVIGEALSDDLERRLRHGEDLSCGSISPTGENRQGGTP